VAFDASAFYVTIAETSAVILGVVGAVFGLRIVNYIDDAVRKTRIEVEKDIKQDIGRLKVDVAAYTSIFNREINRAHISELIGQLQASAIDQPAAYREIVERDVLIVRKIRRRAEAHSHGIVRRLFKGVLAVLAWMAVGSILVPIWLLWFQLGQPLWPPRGPLVVTVLFTLGLFALLGFFLRLLREAASGGIIWWHWTFGPPTPPKGSP